MVTASQKNTADWFQAVIVLLIATVWFLPMVLFWVSAWNAGVVRVCLICLPFMAASLLAQHLPEGYYLPRRFERSGRLYEALGVRAYKRMMMHGDYMNRQMRSAQSDYRVVHNRETLRDFAERTRYNEEVHIGWLLLTIPPTIAALLLGWYGLAAYLALGNLGVNVYPILLQRYNRARLYRVRARWE